VGGRFAIRFEAGDVLWADVLRYVLKRRGGRFVGKRFVERSFVLLTFCSRNVWWGNVR
jgi:hypothetical protein